MPCCGLLVFLPVGRKMWLKKKIKAECQVYMPSILQYPLNILAIFKKLIFLIIHCESVV